MTPPVPAEGRRFSEEASRRMISIAQAAVKHPSWVMFTSSQTGALRRMDRLDPRVPTGLINYRAHGRFDLREVPPFIDALMLDRRAVSAGYVRRAHHNGFLVSARSVNTKAQFLAVKGKCVDRVVTDNWRVTRVH